MPSFVVKANRTDDFYVVWSTIVDAPIRWGSRAELSTGDDRMGAERFERADEYGTSMADPSMPRDKQWFGWDDKTLICMEVQPCTPGVLQRENLRQFCEALGRPFDVETAQAYLKPFDRG